MGTITSTRFYADGPEKDKHKSVDPYTKNKKNKKLKLNQQLSESQEMEFETFEPSANYHDDEEDDVDDPNRPSSTIFTPLDVEGHSEERVFFPAPPPQQSDLSDDESDYDGMSEDDGFGPRMSMVRNAKPRKERIQKQNSISVSGHHGQGLIDEYDDDGIVPPDDDEYDSYDEDDDDHNDHNGAFGGGSFDDDEQQNDDDDNGGYGSMVDSGDEDEESSYLGTESD